MWIDIKNLNITIWWKNILKDISFGLWKWEILSILWHNGSGKTTLLKSIVGLVKSIWDINFDNKNIKDLKVYERSNNWMSYIMQETPEYTWITVYNYIKNIVKDKFDEKEVSKLFDLFGLDYENYKKRGFNQHLSWWEKKKIEIITNFMMDKKLYLLDEVEASLDATSRVILINLILEKAKNWTSFIIVSHNQDLIETASKWILLCNQKIQKKWNVKELFKKYVWECDNCIKQDNCLHKK